MLRLSWSTLQLANRSPAERTVSVAPWLVVADGWLDLILCVDTTNFLNIKKHTKYTKNSNEMMVMMVHSKRRPACIEIATVRKLHVIVSWIAQSAGCLLWLLSHRINAGIAEPASS